jgi:hypothetical protein
MEAIPIIMAVGGAFMEYKAAGDREDAMDRVAQQQEAAGEKAKHIATQNAANIEAETAETVRRETTAAKQAEATRRGKLAASGGSVSGSSANFLEQQAAESDKYIDWLKKSGGSRAAIERERGAYSSASASATAAGTRASSAGGKTRALAGLASAAGGLGQLYNPAAATTTSAPAWNPEKIWVNPY